MFFIGGITKKEERLELPRPLYCEECGQKGQYEFWVDYWSLSFFFIPILKWGRRYRLFSPCCQHWHRLEPEIGRQLVQGQKTRLESEDLLEAEAFYERRRCTYCAQELQEDYAYCPYCGREQNT